MSTETDGIGVRATARTGDSLATVRRVAFGDRVGLSIFLASLCLFGLLWQARIFITDTYALANGLHALARGQIHMTEAAYGPNLLTPGAKRYGGGIISRNYGVLVLSLPFLGLVELLAATTSLRIGFVALWSLTLLALVRQVGTLSDRRWVVTAGSVAVLGLFLSNVAVATPVEARPEYYALQLFHATIAALAPVLLYRLASRIHTRRIGLGAATLLALGTPLALWATVPKRHVVTATVVLAAAYCLYRSRSPGTADAAATPRTFRASAYAAIGLYAWVHAPEALLFCCVLAIVDVPTADDNSPTALAYVAVAFGLSLLPFFVTNWLTTGSPVLPSRMVRTVPEQAAGVGGEGTSGVGGGSSDESVGLLRVLLAPLADLVGSVLEPVLLLGGLIADGAVAVLAEPGDVYVTLFRSSAYSPSAHADGRAVNLALFESAPVLGGLAAAVPAVRRTLGSTAGRARAAALSPARTVDLFCVGSAVGVLLLYTTRLPIHAQVTVRYIFPLFPLGIYCLVRLPAVRTVFADHWRAFVWAVGGGVLVGGQLLVVAVAAGVAGVGEAFQLHALVALGVAVPLALWGVLGRTDDTWGRAGAALLGLGTAATLVFCLLTVLEYYSLGNSHALPLVRVAADLVDVV
ncbi:hypothetical protein [Haloarcula litorea]|uniref:hypothetical protein n=1 Tax=Haloarcula litorea TaxID=3032579 RepID=UPI0023E7CCF9|nr:hypothetical protein [Halomicroarcula sp. GDY20]